MSINLHISATRKIKYECPKTKKWLDDTQRYTLYTPDFNSQDNVSVTESANPYETYCNLVYKYWSEDNLKSQIKVAETIHYLDRQIKEAREKGYTIEWEAW